MPTKKKITVPISFNKDGSINERQTIKSFGKVVAAAGRKKPSKSVMRAESREQVIELLKSETTSDGRAAFPNVHPSKVETFELESSGSSEIIAFI